MMTAASSPAPVVICPPRVGSTRIGVVTDRGDESTATSPTTRTRARPAAAARAIFPSVASFYLLPVLTAMIFSLPMALKTVTKISPSSLSQAS